MFTVKHIRLSDEEDIYESEEVKFTPFNVGQATPPTVWVDGRPITGGTVFVMNGHGQTVARYDLGGSNVAAGISWAS